MTFWLHIDHLANEDGDVWAVRVFGPEPRYIVAHEVEVKVPLETVFRGLHAPQPKAYLKGRARWISKEHLNDRVRVVIQ